MRNRWYMQLAAFDFEITYRTEKINPIDKLSRRPDHEKLNKEKINLPLSTLSNKLNYWRNKTDQSFSAENINVISINIAVLTRRQTKNETYTSSTSRNEAALNTSAHRGPQTKNPLKEFIEDNPLDTSSLPKQIIREAFSSVSPYKRPADTIAILLFNLQ
jgi:hypothetical protein